MQGQSSSNNSFANTSRCDHGSNANNLGLVCLDDCTSMDRVGQSSSGMNSPDAVPRNIDLKVAYEGIGRDMGASSSLHPFQPSATIPSQMYINFLANICDPSLNRRSKFISFCLHRFFVSWDSYAWSTPCNMRIVCLSMVQCFKGNLKRSMICMSLTSGSLVEDPCCICQDEYIDGQELGKLDCGHEPHDFHFDCIKQWLLQKNSCPICKMIALTVGETKSLVSGLSSAKLDISILILSFLFFFSLRRFSLQFG
ncbi:hypothetical protein F0562_006600 [Nyssa sinensis]|uniref:RING-type E3 ubiquitin transferase n=1 Tax=Nyssa sinensis TaxID=561372 RepID=A0A5J5AL24_9ASTE|nr:hypothetical protein F0562_006600 [Nyssa sinensis]